MVNDGSAGQDSLPGRGFIELVQPKPPLADISRAALLSNVNIASELTTVEPRNISDLDRLLMDHYREWGRALTPEMQTGLMGFQANGYGYINEALWQDHVGSLTDFQRDLLDDIDRAVVAAPRIPCNLITYRGIPKYHPGFNAVANLNEGDVYLARGFDSTTIDSQLAENYSGENPQNGVVVTYYVPEGTPAAYLNAIPDSTFDMEHELLLARNLEWRVLKKTSLADGTVNLILSLIPLKNERDKALT